MKRLKTVLVLLFLSIFSFAVFVKADDAVQVNVDISHVLDGDSPAPVTQKYNVGDTLTINKLESEELLYFVVNGKVRLDIEAPYTLTVYNHTIVDLVYKSDTKHAVTFMDTNLDHVRTVYVEDNGNPTEPSATYLTKPMSVFKGWVLLENYGTAVEPLTDVKDITKDSIYVAQYELEEDAKTKLYNVKINGVTTTHLINEVVTATAGTAPDGKVFSHWQDKDGKVLSINPTYKFTVLEDTEISAAYADVKEYNGPVVNMSNAITLRDGYVSYKGQFELGEGQELVEYGFLFSTTNVELVYGGDGVQVARSNVFHSETKEFLRSFPVNTFSVIRAYVRYLDNNELKTVYSENISQSLILHEGFEDFDDKSWPYAITSIDSGIYTWLLKETMVGFDDSDSSSATEANGDKVLRLRGANTAYIESEIFDYVSKVTFDAKYYNSNHTTSVMKISYKVVGSTEWILVKTITLTDSYIPQEVVINKENVRIKIDVTSKSANIDNLKVYGMNVAKPKYTVSFDLDYTGAPTVASQQVKYGLFATNPGEFTRSGYTFKEWQLDGTKYDFTTPITGDINLKAVWEENASNEPVVLVQSDFGETNNSNSNYTTLFKDVQIENGSLDPLPNGKRLWDTLGGNVNGTSWDYIRVGGKNAATKESASVYLQTKFTLDKNVNKIVINIVNLDSASGDEIIYLQTSTNGTTWTDVANKVTIKGDLIFDNLNIASGNYFRFVFERKYTSSNAGTDIKTITFYGNPE